MKIFSVSYLSSYKYNQSQLKPRCNMPLKADCVCFRSRDLLEMSEEEVSKKVRESIVPENFLGQGTEAQVYKIKDTNYCVRIPYWSHDIERYKYSKELTPAEKVNHAVVKLGFGRTIMPYFEGIVPKMYQTNEYSRYKLQEKISDMPIKAYTKLLHQVADAIDNELIFDFTGGNLIVDTDKQKLTAIDFYSISDNPRSVNPLTEIYSSLTCYGAEEKTGKKIFDKIVDTALEEFKPNKIPCMDVALFDFMELCLKRMGKAYTPDGEKIKSSIMFNADSLRKLKKAEILDKTLSPILEQKISDFRILLQKVH